MKLELGPPIALPIKEEKQSLSEALKALAEGIRNSHRTGFTVSPCKLDELAKLAEEKGV